MYTYIYIQIDGLHCQPRRRQVSNLRNRIYHGSYSYHKSAADSGSSVCVVFEGRIEP